jgi:hypothetical protein
VGLLSPADMNKVRQIEATQSAQLDAVTASDVALGQSRRVDSTPTICVTHRGAMTVLPPGAISYTLLKEYLDYLLQH